MIDRLWDMSAVYRLWQSPFERQKFEPARHALAGLDVQSVLDIGCGPGTNAGHFEDVAYVGVDLNPAYISSARKRFGDRFVVGDASRDLPDSGAPYDVILVNSLLHHLDDDQVAGTLRGATALLAEGGAIHVLDLELPSRRSVARFLAEHDRGDYVRPRERWRALLDSLVDVEIFQPYPLGIRGRALWNMFYARATAQSAVTSAT